MSGFTEEQIKRYSRHIILQEVGGKGQRKINSASVLVIGAGGLGCPVSFYLAAAGVGRIGIVDSDAVELSNLQRQILHFTPDLGRPKTVSAREKIQALNPEVEVALYPQRLTSENALDIISGFDVVVDGSDNFPTRYLVNDACVMLGKPFSSGAILRFEAQMTTILPHEGPCYRCLFPEPPPPGLTPSCQEAGVLGALCGTVGAIQATEVLKIIIGKGDLLAGFLLTYDALHMEFRKLRTFRNPSCALCGEQPTITELVDYEEFCAVHS